MVEDFVPHPFKSEASHLACKVRRNRWLELEAPLAVGSSRGTHRDVQRSAPPQTLCELGVLNLRATFADLASFAACAALADVAAFAAGAPFAAFDNASSFLQTSCGHHPQHLVFVGAVPGLRRQRRSLSMRHEGSRCSCNPQCPQLSFINHSPHDVGHVDWLCPTLAEDLELEVVQDSRYNVSGRHEHCVPADNEMPNATIVI